MMETIFDKAHGILRGARRRTFKGRKKKARRMFRAQTKDGWSRKKAGGLRPHRRPSKRELDSEVQLERRSIDG